MENTGLTTKLDELNKAAEAIIDDLDIPEFTKPTYEVWAIGYDSENRVTDAELFLGDFINPDEAIAKAETVTLGNLVAADLVAEINSEKVNDIFKGGFVSIEVETVIPDDDEGIINIGTIYNRTMQVPVVTIDVEETIKMEDNTLQIPVETYGNLKAGDLVTVVYSKDPMTVLCYKVTAITDYKIYLDLDC